jgi:hypothetical protein
MLDYIVRQRIVSSAAGELQQRQKFSHFGALKRICRKLQDHPSLSIRSWRGFIYKIDGVLFIQFPQKSEKTSKIFIFWSPFGCRPAGAGGVFDLIESLDAQPQDALQGPTRTGKQHESL